MKHGKKSVLRAWRGFAWSMVFAMSMPIHLLTLGMPLPVYAISDPLPLCSDAPADNAIDVGAIYAKISFLPGEAGVRNIGPGDMTRTIYTSDGVAYSEGEWILIYDDGVSIVDPSSNMNQPGLVLQRGNGWVRPSIYAFNEEGEYEFANGTITFSNGTIVSMSGNGLESLGDNIPPAGTPEEQIGNDEIYGEPGDVSSDFYMSADIHYDRYRIDYEISDECRDPFADLEVTKVVDDETPDITQEITYTIEVANNGTEDAVNVLVTDVLQSGLTYVSDTVTVGSYDDSTGEWTIGDLANGDTETLTITVTVDEDQSAHTILNNANANSDTYDPDETNNSADADIVVNELICTDTDEDTFYVEGGLCGEAVDCNDNNQDVHPDAIEICGDNIDNNCDGFTDFEDVEACVSTCGDNIWDTDSGEQCEDGNTENGDGCSEFCQLETTPIACEELDEDDAGWYGRYFSYSASHPDMELPRSEWPDDGHGDPLSDSWDTDWYDEEYFMFARIDENIVFGEGWFPTEIAPEELHDDHEFHFGVHWRGLVSVETPGDYGYTLTSDDDAWIYLDGVLVGSNPGLHGPTTVTGDLVLSGDQVVDIYFAERHSGKSAFSFEFTTDGVDFTAAPSHCPLPGVIEYSVYCGDGVVNQDWEQCDGTDGCTIQCQFEEQIECSDLVLAKVTVDDFSNEGAGNMTSDIYLGSKTNIIPSGTWFPLFGNAIEYTDTTSNAYEDVPGLAVQRVSGSIRTVMHTSLTHDDYEEVSGSIELYNATVTGVSEDIGSNRLEGNDVIEVQGSMTSIFYFEATTADDGYYTDWLITETCLEDDGVNICGVKFNDKNQSATQDDGEENLTGWTINLHNLTSCSDGDEWADEVVSATQGRQSNGSTVDIDLSDPLEALGFAPGIDASDSYTMGVEYGETGHGEIVLKFDNVIINGAGDDVKVFEHSLDSPSCEENPEKATIYASKTGEDGTWVELGTACQSATFDLGSLSFAQYIKIVDVTNPDDFEDGFVVSGYDLDGVEALNCSNWELVETVVTTEAGYCFEVIEENGLYQVSEEMQGGWVNSTPVAQSIEIDDDTEDITINFGNYTEELSPEPGSICGYKFEDVDGNGVWDAEEPGIIDWIMHLFPEGSDSSFTTPTNEDGAYCFTGLDAGNYDITEEGREGWTNTTPLIIPVSIAQSQSSVNNNFGNFEFGEISGYKYADANENGEIDEEDILLEGWMIGLFDGEDTITVETDENGFYSFSGLVAGSYEVSEELQDDWIKILPEADNYSIDIISGSAYTDLNFLNQYEEPVIEDPITPPPVTNPGGGGGSGGGGGGAGGTLPLILHTEQALVPGSVTATITWHTNKPATSRVLYGTTSQDGSGVAPNYGYESSTIEDSNKVTFHSVTITGLTPETTYYFRPVSSASPEVLGVELVQETTPEGQTTPPEDSPVVPEGQPDDNTPAAPTDSTLPVVPTQGGAEEEGTVAGVEFAEDNLLAQAGSDVTEITLDDSDPKVIARTGVSDDNEESTSSCATAIWIFLILNIAAAGFAWSRQGKSSTVWKKYLWLIALILSIAPVAIWYAQCWLWVYLLVILAIVGMGAFSKDSQKPIINS